MGHKLLPEPLTQTLPIHPSIFHPPRHPLCLSPSSLACFCLPSGPSPTCQKYILKCHSSILLLIHLSIYASPPRREYSHLSLKRPKFLLSFHPVSGCEGISVSLDFHVFLLLTQVVIDDLMTRIYTHNSSAFQILITQTRRGLLEL